MRRIPAKRGERRCAAAVSALTLAALTLATLLSSCGAGAGTGKPTLRVDRSPFRVSVLSGGKLVVAEDAARLRYQLAANGRVYALTNVISSGDHERRFRVATSEPGRTAEVTVSARRPRGYRIEVALHPAAGVRALYDSFGSPAGTHFLGGGEREASVDLARQVIPVTVGLPLLLSPRSRSSRARRGGGSASRASSPPRLRSRARGAEAAAAPAGGKRCTFPPLVDRAEVCVAGALLDERLYSELASPPARRLRGRHRPAGRAAALRSSN